MQRCEMHGSSRIITNTRHGCRWVGTGESRENLDTTELLRERNVRDRGDLNEACETRTAGRRQEKREREKVKNKSKEKKREREKTTEGRETGK